MLYDKVVEKAKERGISLHEARWRMIAEGLTSSAATRFFKHKQEIAGNNLRIVMRFAEVGPEAERTVEAGVTQGNGILLRNKDVPRDHEWILSLTPAIKSGNNALIKAILQTTLDEIKKRENPKGEPTRNP